MLHSIPLLHTSKYEHLPLFLYTPWVMQYMPNHVLCNLRAYNYGYSICVHPPWVLENGAYRNAILVEHSDLYDIPKPHTWKCKHLSHSVCTLDHAVHGKKEVYTNVYSICLCALSVLENGDVSECYKELCTEQNYKRKFAVVRKLSRNPGNKRFVQSPKQEYEEINVLKKKFLRKNHFTSQKSNRFQEPRMKRSGMKCRSSIVIEILTNLWIS